MGRVTSAFDVLFPDPATAAARAALARRWREGRAWRGETLLEVVDRAAREDPDARIVFASETRPGTVRLGDLLPRVEVAAGGFAALGVGPGDVVAVQLPNWPVTLEAYLGAVAVGAVLVPIPHTYGPSETGWILDASHASVLVCPDRWGDVDFHAKLDAVPWARRGTVLVAGDDPWADAVPWSAFLDASAGPREPVAADPAAPLLVVYTSGTTADPKGVLHSHETFVAELFRMTQAPPERRDWVVVQPWPAGHVAGLLAILSPAITRATTVLVDRWHVDLVARQVEEHRPLAITGAPFHLGELLSRAEAGTLDASSIRYAVTGGAAVPPVLVERAAAAGWSLTRSYGSSEHPQATATDFDDDLAVRIASDGAPVPDTEVRVVDPDTGADVDPGVEGEILLRGPQQFLGYTDPVLNAGAFDRDGWFRTGDVGLLDETGRLTVTDRLKDIIIRGGENLSSMEIEGIALRHPAVADAAAIGVPDARYGERVGLVVVPASDVRVTVDDLRDHFAASGVATAKSPEYVTFTDALPRTPSGKVQKHVLRDAVDFGDSPPRSERRRQHAGVEAEEAGGGVPEDARDGAAVPTRREAGDDLA